MEQHKEVVDLLFHLAHDLVLFLKFHFEIYAFSGLTEWESLCVDLVSSCLTHLDAQNAYKPRFVHKIWNGRNGKISLHVTGTDLILVCGSNLPKDNFKVLMDSIRSQYHSHPRVPIHCRCSKAFMSNDIITQTKVTDQQGLGLCLLFEHY